MECLLEAHVLKLGPLLLVPSWGLGGESHLHWSYKAPSPSLFFALSTLGSEQSPTMVLHTSTGTMRLSTESCNQAFHFSTVLSDILVVGTQKQGTYPVKGKKRRDLKAGNEGLALGCILRRILQTGQPGKLQQLLTSHTQYCFHVCVVDSPARSVISSRPGLLTAELREEVKRVLSLKPFLPCRGRQGQLHFQGVLGNHTDGKAIWRTKKDQGMSDQGYQPMSSCFQVVEDEGGRQAEPHGNPVHPSLPLCRISDAFMPWRTPWLVNKCEAGALSSPQRKCELLLTVIITHPISSVTFAAMLKEWSISYVSLARLCYKYFASQTAVQIFLGCYFQK